LEVPDDPLVAAQEAHEVVVQVMLADLFQGAAGGELPQGLGLDRALQVKMQLGFG
jgi:hypothetical protein